MSERPDADEEALEGLIADALVKRGDLVPTTEAEVREAERALAESDEALELPASLATLSDAPPPRRLRAAANVEGGAVSQKVVSIEELRRARDERRGLSWGHAGTFALGAAVAAAALLYVRTPALDKPTLEPAGGTGPGLSATASSSASAPVVIPSVRVCGGECCAGAGCASAEGELRKCNGGRACVACDVASDPSNAYRLHLGALTPTPKLDAVRLDELDVCARVGGGAWSCLPARSEASAEPAARALPTLASAADLALGVELELRPRGQKLVLGRWRDSVRMSPTLLCLGAGALIADEKAEHLGSVALTLEDTHFVELARGADVTELEARGRRFELGDVTAGVIETQGTGASHFALTVGPLDKGTAERLRWAFLEKKQEATVVLGADYSGAQKLLK